MNVAGNMQISLCNVTTVTYLGIIFDSRMLMDQQVSSLVKSCFYQLKSISRIRKYLTHEAATKVIHAFISSKLDYGNSLLSGLPKYQLNRLQRIQNTAARIVTRINKYDHISPVLYNLHWLPVAKRIVFEILTLVYRCLNNVAPGYLCDFIIPYKPVRALRSTNELLLCVPKIRTKTYGARAFCFIAPSLWNSLPLVVKQSKSYDTFKQTLKTHLFNHELGN